MKWSRIHICVAQCHRKIGLKENVPPTAEALNYTGNFSSGTISSVIDSFTVPIHRSNGREVACHKDCVRGLTDSLWIKGKIPTGDLSPKFTRTCIQITQSQSLMQADDNTRHFHSPLAQPTCHYCCAQGLSLGSNQSPTNHKWRPCLIPPDSLIATRQGLGSSLMTSLTVLRPSS